MQMSSCRVDSSSSNTTYLNQVCAVGGCASAVVNALRAIRNCRSSGLTPLMNQTMQSEDILEQISDYEFACSLHTVGATAASNVYCMQQAASLGTFGGPPPCNVLSGLGCCLANFVAVSEDVTSNKQGKIDYITQTCAIDMSAVTPCQPPSWSNVTFLGNAWLLYSSTVPCRP